MPLTYPLIHQSPHADREMTHRPATPDRPARLPWCSWQKILVNLCMDVVRGLAGGSGLSKQRVVCILLANPILEDPMAHE